MATCFDLTFNRAVSVAIAVEDKERMHQNIKRVWKGSGSGSCPGSDKRQKVVIRSAGPANASYRPSAYPIKNPIYVHPASASTQLPPAHNQNPRLHASNRSKNPLI